LSRISSINIGDFDFRVTFYSQTEGARDAYGNPALSTGSGVERWANVTFKSEKMDVGEGGLQYAEVFEIKVRLDGLTVSVGDRVDWDNRQLHITSIDKVDLVTYKILAQGIE
jgi:hypothetical protein